MKEKKPGILKEKLPKLSNLSINGNVESKKEYIDALKKHRNLGDYKNAIENMEKIISLEPYNINYQIELAHYYYADKQIIKAKEIAKDLLNSHKDDIEVLRLNIFFEILDHNYQESLDLALRLLNKNKNDISNYLNITGSLIELKRYDEAINFSQQSLKIEKNNPSQIANLVKAHTYKKEFKVAFEYVKEIENILPNHSVIPSLGIFLREQLSLDTQFKYLNNPMHFIREYKIPKDDIDKNFFNDLIKYSKKLPMKWEPKNKTTLSGYQTESSLFRENKYPVSKLKDVIEDKIKNYLNSFKGIEDLFIKNFPKITKIKGWTVMLEKNGYQNSHCHPEGWLSGIFYIQIPENKKDNDGSIEFSTHGYDYPKINNNFKKITIRPEEGKLILFPSSLFHKTIPFTGKDQRISIAFDIIQNQTN